MDALSLTILLFVLVFFSFVLGGTEAAFHVEKNSRINRFAKRKDCPDLISNDQLIFLIALVNTFLNAAIIAICIISLNEIIIMNMFDNKLN